MVVFLSMVVFFFGRGATRAGPDDAGTDALLEERRDEDAVAHGARPDDDPHRGKYDPDDVGDDDDGDARARRASIVAVVDVIRKVHDGAVEHLVVDDDGEETEEAWGRACDDVDVWPSRDGDGQRQGWDERHEAVADVHPKAPRRVLDVGRVQRRVRREHDGPIF